MNNARIGPRVDSHFDAPEAPVVHGVGRRISHQILAAQFGLYLTKILEQVIGAAREIGPSAGFFAKTPQHVFANAFEPEPVADANRVNNDARAPRSIDGFVEFPAACVVDAIREQDDRSPRNLLIGGAPSNLITRQHFIGGYVDRVVQRCCLMPNAR